MVQKREYFSSLQKSTLASLLVHVSSIYPSLPLFAPNARDMIPKTGKTRNHHNDMANEKNSVNTSSKSAASAADLSTVSLHYKPKDRQIITELKNRILERNHNRDHNYNTTNNHDNVNSNVNGDDHDHGSDRDHADYDQDDNRVIEGEAEDEEEEDNDENDDNEDHETDPPAHYPHPGAGLARTLGPESEDLEWLVDDNTDVFCHVVYPVARDGVVAAAVAAAAVPPPHTATITTTTTLPVQSNNQNTTLATSTAAATSSFW